MLHTVWPQVVESEMREWQNQVQRGLAARGIDLTAPSEDTHEPYPDPAAAELLSPTSDIDTHTSGLIEGPFALTGTEVLAAATLLPGVDTHSAERAAAADACDDSTAPGSAASSEGSVTPVFSAAVAAAAAMAQGAVSEFVALAVRKTEESDASRAGSAGGATPPMEGHVVMTVRKTEDA